MDPDRVDAAGDLADAATTCVGVGGGGRAGSSEESWARALLRRGWDLSRKAAIAGAAATAVPVIAPPIIILSIAGVALSVPFAAYLASLAATDRLMAALLPPAPPRPYYAYDDEFGDEESEQEFVDASEAPDEEAPVFGHWSRTEEDAIVEPNSSIPSLPLSLEPRLSEELVPLLASEDGDIAEGEVEIQKSDDHELFPPKDGKQENGTAMEVDNEFITMEAPSPGDVSGLAASLLHEEDDMVPGMEDAPTPAGKELVEELSASDNGEKTEYTKSAITEEAESRKEFPSSGVDATGSSDLALPKLGNEDIMVHRGGEGEVSVSKTGQDSHVSDRGDKAEPHNTTEVMLPPELNVSESSVPDDNTVLGKTEDELTVEMAPEEGIIDANPVAVEVVDVQLDALATAVPQSESLQSSSDHVAGELQAMTESADVYCTRGSTLAQGVVKDVDDKGTGDVEHRGVAGVCSVVPVPSLVTKDDDKDLFSTRSTPTPHVSAISEEAVESWPQSDDPRQTAGAANKELGKEEVAEDKCAKTEEIKTMDGKVPTTDMETKDNQVFKTPASDDQSKRDDEVTVEMVLEEVTSRIDPVTGEVVEVQVNIIASESESLPLSDLMAHDLQAVTGAGMVDAKMKGTMKGIDDTNKKCVKQVSEEGACSFVSVTSVVTMDDGEDLVSSRSTPYASAISNDMTSIEGGPDVDHHHRKIDVGHKVMNEGFGTKELAEDKDIYTEEQLRDQLDTLRTITGYRAVPSLTLEGDLAGLYIFVGVEPPHSSGDASDLMELNTKLQFLKSIIGVE